MLKGKLAQKKLNGRKLSFKILNAAKDFANQRFCKTNNSIGKIMEKLEYYMLFLGMSNH